MKITINDKRKIFAVQEAFTNVFPYLKLEFFAKPHKPGAPSSEKFIKHHNKTLGDCRTIHTTGIITITSNMTVGELEQHFCDVYGLGVQVFRRSGNLWLETTITDNWTLDRQNKEGESFNHYLEQRKTTLEKDQARS